jgi:hypothetical protein
MLVSRTPNANYVPNTDERPSPVDQTGTASSAQVQASGGAMLDALPVRAKHSGSPFFAGSTQRPLAEIKRLGTGRSERIADMKAVALERETMAPVSNQEGSSALSPGLKDRIQDVAQQLAVRCVVTPETGKPQAPVPGAWRYLQAIDSMRPKLNAAQLAEAAHDLHTAMTASAHPAVDKDLLLDVIAEITRPNGIPLNRYMADKAYAGLCLPNLKMIESGEKEPNSRTFNSALPNLAESTYDHNPLGRTLLWEGASRLFAGPHQAERRDKLRKVVFDFPNAPKTGQPKLETPWDFIMAVDELKVDEDVDLSALRAQS